MYDELKEQLRILIDMRKNPQKYTEIDVMNQRIRILELMVGSLIVREQAAVKNEQRALSTLDLDLSKLLDIMKSEVQVVNAVREET